VSSLKLTINLYINVFDGCDCHRMLRSVAVRLARPLTATAARPVAVAARPMSARMASTPAVFVDENTRVLVQGTGTYTFARHHMPTLVQEYTTRI
jgi:hypothetical protein